MKKRKPCPAKRRKPHSSRKRKIRHPKVDFEFTDLDLTAFGGASILAQTARRFGLFELLDGAVSVKVRNRGASDAQTLWAIVVSLARGLGLHGTFLGGLWSAGQLQPGGGRVTLNWRRLLGWSGEVLAEGTPVWLRADNAYYKGELVGLCAEQGWDYSISVTNDRWRR